MSSELTIATIVNSKSKKTIKIQCNWAEDGVKFLLNDGITSWTANFDDSELDEDTLLQLELTKEEYMVRMKSAFATPNGNSKFRFTLENDALSWAKVISKDAFQLHGTIQLAEVDEANHGKLVRSLLESYGSVLEELSQSVQRYNTLEKEYREINSAFDKCCKMKDEMEKTLYAKFALILNEKKEYVKRVTGDYPHESFGPTPLTEPQMSSDFDEQNSRKVPLTTLSKMMKRDKSISNERPPKKQMTAPGTSHWSDEDMEI